MHLLPLQYDNLEFQICRINNAIVVLHKWILTRKFDIHYIGIVVLVSVVLKRCECALKFYLAP